MGEDEILQQQAELTPTLTLTLTLTPFLILSLRLT